MNQIYTAQEALGIARSIAMQCKIGNMSYDEGKKQATPFLNIANEKSAEISKKHGKKTYKFKWEGMTR